MAITTALALRTNYLNIPDGSQDAILTALIGQAQSMMKSICMQPLEQTAIEETFTGTGTMYKSLSYTVPVTLSTLSYRLLPSDSWSSVAGGVIYTSGSTDLPLTTLLITGGHAWATADRPAALTT